jgi:hypothetical protein
MMNRNARRRLQQFMMTAQGLVSLWSLCLSRGFVKKASAEFDAGRVLTSFFFGMALIQSVEWRQASGPSTNNQYKSIATVGSELTARLIGSNCTV